MKNAFQIWADWYASAESRQMDIPWHSSRALTTAERSVIAASIAEFQLGEGSDGRRLHAGALRYAQRHGQPAYADAIRDFIREENRHSHMLGRFMDMEGIPRLRHSRADWLFRKLRHMAPLHLSHGILLTAELLAVPYYRALSQATCSPALKAICSQILEDEARHIAFQAQVIRMLRPRARWRQSLHNALSRFFLEAALDIVWWNHSDVLRQGGYGFARLRVEGLEQLDWAMSMISGEIPIPQPQHPSAPPRSNEVAPQLLPSGI